MNNTRKANVRWNKIIGSISDLKWFLTITSPHCPLFPLYQQTKHHHRGANAPVPTSWLFSLSRANDRPIYSSCFSPLPLICLPNLNSFLHKKGGNMYGNSTSVPLLFPSSWYPCGFPAINSVSYQRKGAPVCHSAHCRQCLANKDTWLQEKNHSSLEECISTVSLSS